MKRLKDYIEQETGRTNITIHATEKLLSERYGIVYKVLYATDSNLMHVHSLTQHQYYNLTGRL